MPVMTVAVVIVAYLIGTFPSALLVGRRHGFDPTAVGSGNPGASNSTRIGGWRAGALVLAGDAGKGIIAAGLGHAVDGRTLAWLAGAAAVAGHMWPVTRQLIGGKGVATAAGVGLVCAPFVTISLLVGFGLLVRATGKAAIGSIVIATLFPFGVAFTGQTAVEVVIAALVGGAIVARHGSNIRRLLSGTEARMSTSGD